MVAFVKKLERLLQKEFPPPDLIELDDDDGILGRIVSDRFKHKDTMDRINLIWDYLDQHLTKEEKRKIVLISPVTHKEHLLYSA